jgi:hypothetical protein
MSRFVYLHFVGTAGTKEGACADARNMVQCIVHWRSTVPEVDLFALFLEEAFGPDDVDFFLYLQRGMQDVAMAPLALRCLLPAACCL